MAILMHTAENPTSLGVGRDKDMINTIRPPEKVV